MFGECLFSVLLIAVNAIRIYTTNKSYMEVILFHEVFFQCLTQCLIFNLWVRNFNKNYLIKQKQDRLLSNVWDYPPLTSFNGGYRYIHVLANIYIVSRQNCYKTLQIHENRLDLMFHRSEPKVDTIVLLYNINSLKKITSNLYQVNQ